MPAKIKPVADNASQQSHPYHHQQQQKQHRLRGIIATNSLRKRELQQNLPITPNHEITTTFLGGPAQSGSMFDIYAKADITLMEMDIHTTSTTATENIEVWTKDGSLVGYENDPVQWLMIGCSQLVGKGYYEATPIPSDYMNWIPISAGATKAIYTSFVYPGAYMQYSATNISNPPLFTGDVYSENNDLQIIIGAGKTYYFGAGTFSNRIWNGNVRYSLGLQQRPIPSQDFENCRPSMTPSKAPSFSPTLSKAPAIHPSVGPTNSPTHTPSVLSSHIPSLLPSFRPSNDISTTPSTAPSGMPSVKPIGVPSLQPSFKRSLSPSIGQSVVLSSLPSDHPSAVPSYEPSNFPTKLPSKLPSFIPTKHPSDLPTDQPSVLPSMPPTIIHVPSDTPTASTTVHPTVITTAPSHNPSIPPTLTPSVRPTSEPTVQSSSKPSTTPSTEPSTVLPTSMPWVIFYTTKESSDEPSQTGSTSTLSDGAAGVAAVAAAAGETYWKQHKTKLPSFDLLYDFDSLFS